MAFTREIDWPSTIATVQAALDGTTNGPLSQASLTSGVAAREAVRTAGLAYDAQSTDGIANQSAYALSVQAWAATAQPIWIELDRVCRAVFKLVPPPIDAELAAFGIAGLPTWQPNTDYSSTTLSQAGVVPTVTHAVGCTFLCTDGGRSGSTEPNWVTTIGQPLTDGTAQWTCASSLTASAGSQPAALPWDVTVRTEFSLTSRGQAASLQSHLVNALQILVTNSLNAWITIRAAKPASNVAADALSNDANDALNAAIAQANMWIAASAIR